ncbi:MAG: hypothetical protein LBP52_04295, partial [Burkholderiaceae bacterium]|nr:hypothetical protein [Burkholderiaceae bacterium]
LPELVRHQPRLNPLDQGTLQRRTGCGSERQYTYLRIDSKPKADVDLAAAVENMRRQSRNQEK